jgi:hypothetical protein
MAKNKKSSCTPNDNDVLECYMRSYFSSKPCVVFCCPNKNVAGHLKRDPSLKAGDVVNSAYLIVPVEKPASPLWADSVATAECNSYEEKEWGGVFAWSGWSFVSNN